MENKKNIATPFILFSSVWFVAIIGYDYYALNVIFLGTFGTHFLWLLFGILLSSIVALFLNYKIKRSKMHTVRILLAILFILLLTQGVFMGLEQLKMFSASWRGTYAQLRFLLNFVGQGVDWLVLGVLSLVIFVLYLLIPIPLQKKFFLYRRLIDKRFEKSDAESYQKWLLQEVSTYPKALELKRVPQNIAFHLTLMLIFGFFAILREPASSAVLSLLFLPAVVSALGLFLIFKQQRTLLDWILKGYRIAEHTEIQWNRLILMLLIPVVILPLLIPWNFRVVNLDAFSKSLNNQFSGVSLQIGNRIDSSRHFTVNTNTAVVTEREQDRFSHPTNKKSFFLLYLQRFALFYLALVVIGAILYLLRRKGHYSHPVPRFFVFQFDLVIKILWGILQLLSMSVRILLALIGIHPKEKDSKELAEPIKQQLRQLFEIDKAISEEKKDEMNRVIAAFVKLIEAAGRIVLPYKYFYGPMEYVEKLIGILPQHREILLQVVSVFNESRYSLHLISEQILEDYEMEIDQFIESL